jgi:hypothetical protein
VWAATKGLRHLILAMTLLTATIGAFEALLFSMLGSVVDWLAKVPPNQLWATQKQHLLLLAGILLASPLLIWLQTHRQAPDAGHQLSAAPALELPPPDAGPEHGVLSATSSPAASPPKSCKPRWRCAR